MILSSADGASGSVLKWFMVLFAFVSVTLAAWRRKMRPRSRGKTLGKDPTKIVVVAQKNEGVFVAETSTATEKSASEAAPAVTDAPEKPTPATTSVESPTTSQFAQAKKDAEMKEATATPNQAAKKAVRATSKKTDRKSGLIDPTKEPKLPTETPKAAAKTATASKSAAPLPGSSSKTFQDLPRTPPRRAVAAGFLHGSTKDAKANKEEAPTAVKESSNVSQGLSDQDTDPPQDAEASKALGNKAVAVGDHAGAIEHYTHGIEMDPEHAILHCNRALCLHKLGRLEEALADSKVCIELRPDFAKAFIRAGKVLMELGRPTEAMELLKKAPSHAEVGNLVSEIRPEAEAAEEKRISALGGAERNKEEGNALFKKGLFEHALAQYTKGLQKCTDPTAELTIALRNNRAACHQQLSNYHGVVEDTTAVLEIQPDNLKALCRRMVAYEPLEKYQKALDDARAVLKYVPGHEAANKLQHRLGKLVRDLQREERGEATLGR